LSAPHGFGHARRADVHFMTLFWLAAVACVQEPTQVYAQGFSHRTRLDLCVLRRFGQQPSFGGSVLGVLPRQPLQLRILCAGDDAQQRRQLLQIRATHLQLVG
jgi:hypothetical protein